MPTTSTTFFIRGRHGFSKGRDFVCEVGCGLFQSGVAHCGKWEYSLHVKACPCQIFCFGGEERACGGLRVRIVLSAAPVFLSALLFVSATLEFFSCRLHLIGPFNCAELLPDNNILHIFILHTQIIKMGITPSSHN